MLIKWLRLKNIRSYVSASIDFPQGSVLLSGDIGSGKSTVLLSIEFALFGLIKGETSGASLLRNGEPKGSVELCLEICEKEVIINRLLKRGRNGISQESGNIVINGARQEATSLELKSIILSLLGYPQDMLREKNLLFRYTTYTPQEEMKKIIFAEKEERLSILRRLFGIDRYKLILENSGMLARRMKDECREIEGYVADMDDKKSFLDRLKERQAQLLSESATLKDKVKAAREKMETGEAKVASVKGKVQKHDRLTAELLALESAGKQLSLRISSNSLAIARLGREIKEIMDSEEGGVMNADADKREQMEKELILREKAFLARKQEYAGLSEKSAMHARNAERYRPLVKDYLQNEGERSMVQKRLKEVSGSLQAKQGIMEDKERLNSELISIEASIAKASSRLEASKKSCAAVSSMDECPLCLQRIDNEHKAGVISREERLAAELGNELDKLKQRKEAIVKGIGEARLSMQRIESLEREHLSLQARQGRIDALAMQNAKNERELAVEEAGHLKANEALNSIDSKSLSLEEAGIAGLKQELKKLGELLLKKGVLEEKKQACNLLEAEAKVLCEKALELDNKKAGQKLALAAFAGINAIYSEEESALDLAREECKSLEIRAAETAALLGSLGEDIARTSLEVLKKLGEKSRMMLKRQYIAWLDSSFTGIIALIEKSIMSAIYSEFNSLFQEWFSVLVDDEMLSVSIDDEFTPVVQQNGYDSEVMNLSGGEKTALSLAYRLALNKVINSLTTGINTTDLIILDEPTDGFSESQLDRIRDVLELLKMKQVIIVSHESKIESYVESIIRIRKEGHESIIV